MTDVEKKSLEDFVETELLNWKTSQLTQKALEAYRKSHIVILDVLEATPVRTALVEQVPQKDICTALLFVPFQKYPARVKQRNQNAIQENKENNLRDGFDVIEQYRLLFKVEAEMTDQTVQEITSNMLRTGFEQAKNDSIELFTQTAQIYQGKGLFDKAQWDLDEVKTLQEKGEETIQKRIHVMNPFNLEHGYLTVNHPVDAILNTDTMSTKELVEKILAITH